MLGRRASRAYRYLCYTIISHASKNQITGGYMRKVIILGLFALLVLASCATIKEEYKNETGAIKLPDPEIKFVLEYTKEDMEILGDIDITKEISIANASSWEFSKKTTEIEKRGIIFNEKSYPISGPFSAIKETPEDILLSYILYDAITQYPEMDYVLFPKIEMIKKTNTGSLDAETNKIIIRFRGKAVKIKL